MAWANRINTAVAHSIIGKHFQLEGSGARRERKGTRFLTEIRAGITIFFAMVRRAIHATLNYQLILSLYYRLTLSR
jgi:hypothetical protein